MHRQVVSKICNCAGAHKVGPVASEKPAMATAIPVMLTVIDLAGMGQLPKVVL